MDGRLVETAEEVSQIAFGFMASKALFAGLHVDVFTVLADGPKKSPEISQKTGIPTNRITTLMTALTSIGLVDRSDDEVYSNSPGAEAFLSRTAKYDFGDYLRYQIDKQMYPFLQQLNEVIDGSLDPDAVDSYQHWMADPEQAAIYSDAQHAGSLGPGKTLARLVDLSGAKQMLDVAGGRLRRRGVLPDELRDGRVALVLGPLQSGVAAFGGQLGVGLGAQQGLHARLVRLASGIHQGGVAVDVLQVGVGRVLQEEEQDGEVVAERSNHERGVAGVRHRVSPRVLSQ